MQGPDPIWESIFSSSEWGKYPPEHIVRFVARNFYRAAARRSVKLLDLGAGTGACTWYMAREGFSVSAIDGAPSAIRRLRERLASEGLEVDARVGDFAELPWSDCMFDGVVDNCALYANSAAHAFRTLAEVARVLAPGGKFQSTWFSDRTWGYGTGPRAEPGAFHHVTEGPIAHRGFVRFVGRPELDAMFTSFAAFTVERSSYTLPEGQVVEYWPVRETKG